MNLSTWFLDAYSRFLAGEPTLPTPPFNLKPEKTFTSMEAYEIFCSEVERALAFQRGQLEKPPPRFKCGALQEDLKSLFLLTLPIAVVNVHKCDRTSPAFEYIGRESLKLGLKGSPLANPFVLNAEKDRDRVCQDFESKKLAPAMQSRTGPVWDELCRLSDRVLRGESVEVACYCFPKRCHGHSVVRAVGAIAIRLKTNHRKT